MVMSLMRQANSAKICIWPYFNISSNFAYGDLVMGTFYWYLQRATAMILLAYVVFVSFSYLIKPWGIDASVWHNDINSLEMKIFTFLFIVSMVIHSIQGLKAVEDDYFSERTLGMFVSGLGSYARIFRFIYRAFIVLVILIISYIVVFNYLMGM